MKTLVHCFSIRGIRRLTFLVFLLISNIALHAQPTVTTGKSYINITRPNGGTFLPGDVIEVRATIAVTGGNNSSSSNRVNSVRYNDTINIAKFQYIPGSLQMKSNEGRLQRAYSDNADTDSAHINTVNGQIRFNIGNGSGAANVGTQGTSITNAGSLWGALRPTFFGNTCIRMYVYRVTIRNVSTVVDIDSTIRMSAGNFRYRIGTSTTDQLSNFSPYMIQIAPDYGLCSNSTGSNAVVGESGGTFGSGIPQNRAGGTTFVPGPYTFLNFAANSPNDNFYGLANRTSSDGTTNPNVPYSTGTGSASRVFTVWDIIGDHTGAVDPIKGNPPTNTGYAVIINASYQTNRAFTQTINGLCEETFYEFSAWFRNICRRCGCDSTGRGASQSGYTPGPGNDSAGVKPNLSFQIDGVDYYTSGNIPYDGNWVKKGFVFKTRPGQTSMVVTIRNNAPGGGGNDWAIDDIGVTTCLPNMSYSPSLTPNVCENSNIVLYDTVRSFFNNYTYYQWQKSTDAGTTWTNLGSPAGPVTPVMVNGMYQFVSSYTITGANTTAMNNGDRYRLIVGTSLTNLTVSTCRSTDNVNIVALNVLTDCGPVLDVKLTGFSGNIINDKANLRWTTSGESSVVQFDIEKSSDGTNFQVIATKAGLGNSGNELRHYEFVDPNPVTSKAYYRIRLREAGNRAIFSKILQLTSVRHGFDFVSVINPFRNQLDFDISSLTAGTIKVELVNQAGTAVIRRSMEIREGVNQLALTNTEGLANGIYILRVEHKGKYITKRVLKN